MNKSIIEVKNIGKQYKITHERGKYVALRDVIANIARKPAAFIADKAKAAAGLKKKEEFWALRNLNFEVKKGEVVGIIGHNGAGKSTLLKILSQITPPTEGEIIIRGRVGSLLEVGTGFHPELSGRENIFLNGAILGMTRKEMAAKFDQIVEFAGIEKFLDTPVKFYSSGMYVRLAFSVAAHMEPDILLVDEVLAVGDADFQKKCLGKMDEITRKDGRTILFVSHNMAAIRDLCTKTILLNKGEIEMIGPTEEVLERYRALSGETVVTDLRTETNRRGNGALTLTQFRIENSDHESITTVSAHQSADFVFTYETKRPESVSDIDLGFSVTRNGQILAVIYSSDMHHKLTPAKYQGEIRFTVKDVPFTPGVYGVGARVLVNGVEADWPKTEIGHFEVIAPDKTSFHKFNSSSAILLEGSWKMEL
jgi:lipopolysaccharide transport system ATP-binding protein